MRSSIVLMLAALSLSAAACTAETSSTEPAAVDESELRSPSLTGSYSPNGADDNEGVSAVRVDKVGAKLVLHIDEYGEDHAYDLTKTRSGAYVFTSGEFSGECDDPGCHYTIKFSGVVYLKKVGNKKVPSVKLNVTELYPYPESEGDLEGEQTSTIRWSKKSR